MNLDDLKEKLKSDLQTTWERFQDSSVYGQLKDRYDNLSPVMQKVVIGLSVALVAYILLMTPLDYFSNSSQQLAGFEDDRQMIRDLLKVSRETSSGPDIAPAPPIESLTSRIQGELQGSRLTAEQIAGVNVINSSSALIPDALMSGQIEVQVKQINVRQMTEIGTKLSQLGEAVKLKDLIMQPSIKDPRYMDVTYKIAVLNIPSNEIDATPEEPVRGKGRQ